MKIKRECDGCTACCDGWLVGEIYKKPFYPGCKCHFVTNSGCSIYKKRPNDPCKTFKCEWLVNEDIPSWMKPNLSNTIITYKTSKLGIKYMNVIECGIKLDSSVLSWLIKYCLNKNINLFYKISGGNNYIGSNDFIKEMSNTYRT